MTENEAIARIKYRMHTVEQVAGKGGMEDLEMAVNALEEIQRWHTSVVNPNVKNEFANRSTQICVNCDHKDEYIEELEAEVEEYRAIGTPEECQAAMEKQIPYKPSRKKLVWGIGKCKCGVEFLDRQTGFCGNCGQKLDWEGERWED